ncbi:flavin-containing monooxygenase [Aspergillus aculeatinus CBS 121060]|uniref:Monooxygenase n=1 Tax=Aspergillus aculeatinus CBS 121060 TaxID=1448322 RepID=A0ACD1GSB7_9EURO|nr:monooxygenase [Aspergillus aculeatinus CBS 121060]RAH64217.1 monooxygenase [Aspergillus aculeatinus CBS 121060]
MALPSKPATTVIIIGAGFSGVAMGCQLKRNYDLEDYCIYDRCSGIGGTWWSNRYPGCSVDIPAISYSLSFAKNPSFTKLFPQQSEALDYISDVARTYGVNRQFVGNVEWKCATWKEDTETWLLQFEDLQTGRHFTQACRILISAVGGVVNPHPFTMPGVETFRGPIVHTAQWRSDIDLRYKHVAVIGNGSSFVQLVPAIIDEVKTITHFMRTPHYLVPTKNHDIPPLWRRLLCYVPGLLWLLRALMFLYMETAWPQFNKTRWGSRARQKSVQRSLNYVQSTAPHSKSWRRVFDQGYLPCLQRDNIRLTDDPVVEILPTSIRTQSGDQISTDVIILATGFSLTQYDTPLYSREGISRQQHWQELGSRLAFESVAMHGFPNFFYILGPNSGRAHTSTLFSIENHVDLVISVIAPIIQNKASAVELDANSERKYYSLLRAALQNTVHDETCSSYFVDKKTGTNWFSYPWSSLWQWISTHWVRAELISPEDPHVLFDLQLMRCQNRIS